MWKYIEQSKSRGCWRIINGNVKDYILCVSLCSLRGIKPQSVWFLVYYSHYTSMNYYGHALHNPPSWDPDKAEQPDSPCCCCCWWVNHEMSNHQAKLQQQTMWLALASPGGRHQAKPPPQTLFALCLWKQSPSKAKRMQRTTNQTPRQTDRLAE